MNLTPKQIVEELDKYIIGQEKAKRAVAVALRNRYRRSMLSPELREEITPKNIIMKGPTGVGKTEIARRLAKLVKAPFIKVEATKYTEVGYVGRDVESMIRDLVEASVRMVREEQFATVSARAAAASSDHANAHLPTPTRTTFAPFPFMTTPPEANLSFAPFASQATRLDEASRNHPARPNGSTSGLEHMACH